MSEKAINALTVSAEKLIGYFYAGLLTMAILAIENQNFVESFVKATGGFLAAIICFAVGICIFTIYFRILGGFAIYLFQHAIHILFDLLCRRKPHERTSTIGLLVYLKVPLLRTRGAYEKIKESFFTQQERSGIQIAHGELHVVYLTSVITFSTYFIIKCTTGTPSNIYLLIAIISFLAALIGDTRQHSHEAFLIKIKIEDIKEFLSEHGYIKK